MVRIPVSLRSVSRIQQVLNCKPMQSIATSNYLHYIPTQSINVNPPADCPIWAWRSHELDQLCIVQLVLLYVILRKVD